MKPPKNGIICNVKAARKAKGFSQTELAELVGVKRQAIYDMESGRYVPNTIIALHLAKELGCRVEDLFKMEGSECEHPATLVGHAGMPGARVSVVRVRDRLVAYPLDGKWLLSEGLQSADGLLEGAGGNVRLLQDEEHLEKKVLLLGCDPAFSILAAHVSRQGRGAELRCRFASSYRALEGVVAGHAHLAAAHLHNSGHEESNVEAAKSHLKGSQAVVIGFSLFEEGLMVASGNPYGIRMVDDLVQKGLRFVNRDHGAAVRVLLDDYLNRAGVPANEVHGYDRLVSSHIEGAQMVAFGLADAALGLRAVAATYRLDFVPMQHVRCDLIIHRDFLEHPVVKIILDVLQTSALCRDLSSLPGYESSMTGRIVGEF